jgi:acylphosphatase
MSTDPDADGGADRGEEELLRRRVVVHGRVQNVWFRASTRAEAQRVGACGWVRNLRDGTVEAVFEGPADVVEAMVHYCHTGPRGAGVERVDVTREDPEGLADFQVR